MNRLNDDQVEALISQVLRVGTLLSCSVAVLGLILYLLHHSSAVPDYGVFHSFGEKSLGFGELVSAALHGNSVAVIQLGILLLIATPVARVLFLVVAFALERDRLYVVVSGVVLAILLYSLVFFR
jgi:uncharacterized membrane protein